MFELIRDNQLNIMLALCAVCFTMAVLLYFTKFLSKKRKWILITMEVVATLLLFFDRFAYIYGGDTTAVGYVMVRLSNFMVFFLTSAIVLIFNLYLIDLLLNEGKQKIIPRRLNFVSLAAISGILLVLVSAFTGLYYSFDEQNVYHRGPGFLICYFVPVICPIIQFSVIRKFRKSFSSLIYLAIVLYIFVPIIVGIIQIFTYGISIVNMTMVLVSISLYILTYLDVNAEIEKAHDSEVLTLLDREKTLKKLFYQTTKAIVDGIEKKDVFLQGQSARVANCAKLIAQKSGKTEGECDRIFYSALLHNVGLVALDENLNENDKTEQISVASAKILSAAIDFPYLSAASRCLNERYDGKGFPQRLSGEKIPEEARILAVALAYENMQTIPKPLVREEFVREAGQKFDPNFANIMVKLIDEEKSKQTPVYLEQIESEIKCDKYRDSISLGLPVVGIITKICFSSVPLSENEPFSCPSVILFDSYDCRVHSREKSIEAYHYIEYGELWFDGHIVSTRARTMEASVKENPTELEQGMFEIMTVRYDDHLKVQMKSGRKEVEVVVALPDSSKSAYISLTGENCHISNISVSQLDKEIDKDEITRIAEKISYINRLESDIKNVQIDNWCSAFTEAIPLHDRVTLNFHTMSLPTANLVWHCPYIVIFYSEDKKIGGKGYREYAFIKLNGESNGSNSFAENKFSMKKKENFFGWDEWKAMNKAGMECEIKFFREKNKITTITENLGISIENTTKICNSANANSANANANSANEVYIAITGDQIALTDIRIR